MRKQSRTAFISYTRQEGTAYAERVHRLLKESGITVWQDKTQMLGGNDFWKQIEEAIERCSYLVMVVTPDAFEGERRVLRQEWTTARKAGTCVVPVKGQRDMKISKECVPGWLLSRHVYDIDDALEVQRFVEQLKSKCAIERIPYMADDLPENFTMRAAEFEALIGLLLDNRRESPVAVTTALRGAGGFGKTTLAQAICQDDRIVLAFGDGILWATLGEDPHVIDKLRIMYAALTNERPSFLDKEDARLALAAKLEYKRCLIVIDDVWDYAHLQPFLLGGPNCARLITTRQTSIAAQADARAIPVDEMTKDQAATMLAASLPQGVLGGIRLRELASRLGEWPVLLNLFAGHVRESVTAFGQTVDAAVAEMLNVLNQSGVTAFDRESADDRNQAIAATLGVSLRRLSSDEATCCSELAVFPEDLDIPLTLIGELWHKSETETRMRLRRFANLGLINLNLATKSVRLHDIIRAYLEQRQLAAPERAHSRLVDAWSDYCRLPHDYAWRWLTHHLSCAKRTDELHHLLTDFEWLRAKLEATDTGELIADFDVLQKHDVLRLVQGALLLGADRLLVDKSQLPSQLLGRLGHGIAPEIDVLVDASAGSRQGTWLRPLQPTLLAPGGPLVRVLRGYAAGHDGTVRSLALDETARWAISAGNSTQDQAVIIWNLRAGSHRRLPGQAEPGGYTPLAITPDGSRALSARGSELRVWSVSDAKQLMALSGDDASVSALAVAADGDLAVSGTTDGSVWLLNLTDRRPQLIGRHSDRVDAVAVTSQGRQALSLSASEAKVWDLEQERLISKWSSPGFVPHNFAHCLALSDDGQEAFWGGYAEVEHYPDGGASYAGGPALRARNAAHSDIRLYQHPDVLGFLTVAADGRRALVACPSPEGYSERVALCELSNAPRIVLLPSLGRGVSTAAISRDGRWAITADYEHDLFVWDLNLAMKALPQAPAAPWHQKKFKGFSVDGRSAVFALDDGGRMVCDVETGAPVSNGLEPEHWQERPDPPQRDESIEADADGRGQRLPAKKKPVKKGSDSLGDLERARGHSARVKCHRVAPNGRWDVTVSVDGTARVWDIGGKRPLATFSGEFELTGCQWSPDSWTLAVTNVHNETHLLRLEGVAKMGLSAATTC